MNFDHTFFTELIVDEIHKQFSSNTILIQSDLSIHENPKATPIWVKGKTKPLIRKPDVIARDDDSKNKIFIFGEAKTERDFIRCSERRNAQLDYYLNFLKHMNNGTLIYALPRSVKRILMELIEEKKEEWGAHNVRSIVITDVDYLEQRLN